MKSLVTNIVVAFFAFVGGVFGTYLWFSEGLYTSALLDNTVIEVVIDDFRSTKEEDISGTQLSELFVFVGEKIEVVEYLPLDGEIWFDQAFDAKYKIIETIHGEFEGNIIEFRAFDHYGYPPFARTTHALLFVSKHKGKLYHEKYQYYSVHQTTNGRWAACGDPYIVDDYHRKPFEPKPLDFHNDVVIEQGKLTAKQFDTIYPEPYFEHNGKRAICRLGAYVDELFQIKRDGVLKARGVGQE